MRVNRRQGAVLRSAGKGIYFDFNEPVITNTTLNTIADFSGIRTISTSFDATLYPNPASSSTEALLNLDRKTKLSYRIINPLGAVVASEVLGEKEAGAQRINIETGSISSGIYFVEFKERINNRNIYWRVY